MAARCAAGIVESQKATKAGARGREAAARWKIASNVLYPLKYQVPHSTAALDAALQKIQVAMDQVSTGGFHGTWKHTRLQPRQEGGLGRMSIARHLNATWHRLGLEVVNSADARPWKNFYAYYVRKCMPETVSYTHLTLPTTD